MRLPTSGKTSCETNFVFGPVDLWIMKLQPIITEEDVHFCEVQYSEVYEFLMISDSDLHFYKVHDLS
jgi:hypothetical protein